MKGIDKHGAVGNRVCMTSQRLNTVELATTVYLVNVMLQKVGF